MKGFDQQTIRDLEFLQLREWLSGYAFQPTARKRLEELTPSNDFSFVENELHRANEFKSIRVEGESFPA